MPEEIPEDLIDLINQTIKELGPIIKEAIEEATIITAATQIVLNISQAGDSKDIETYTEQVAKARHLIKKHSSRQ